MTSCCSLQARPCNTQQAGTASDHWHGQCSRHAPAWCPRLYTQLDSGGDYSVATGTGHRSGAWSAAWRLDSGGDYSVATGTGHRSGAWSAAWRLFDAVLYAVKIVARFYKYTNLYKKAVLPREETRDAVVNFYMYRSLQRHRAVFTAKARLSYQRK